MQKALNKKSKKKDAHILVNPYAEAEEAENAKEETPAVDKDSNINHTPETAAKTMVLPTTKTAADTNTATTADIISTIIDDDDLDDND